MFSKKKPQQTLVQKEQNTHYIKMRETLKHNKEINKTATLLHTLTQDKFTEQLKTPESLLNRSDDITDDEIGAANPSATEIAPTLANSMIASILMFMKKLQSPYSAAHIFSKNCIGDISSKIISSFPETNQLEFIKNIENYNLGFENISNKLYTSLDVALGYLNQLNNMNIDSKTSETTFLSFQENIKNAYDYGILRLRNNLTFINFIKTTLTKRNLINVDQNAMLKNMITALNTQITDLNSVHNNIVERFPRLKKEYVPDTQNTIPQDEVGAGDEEIVSLLDEEVRQQTPLTKQTKDNPELPQQESSLIADDTPPKPIVIADTSYAPNNDCFKAIWTPGRQHIELYQRGKRVDTVAVVSKPFPSSPNTATGENTPSVTQTESVTQAQPVPQAGNVASGPTPPPPPPPPGLKDKKPGEKFLHFRKTENKDCLIKQDENTKTFKEVSNIFVWFEEANLNIEYMYRGQPKTLCIAEADLEKRGSNEGEKLKAYIEKNKTVRITLAGTNRGDFDSTDLPDCLKNIFLTNIFQTPRGIPKASLAQSSGGDLHTNLIRELKERHKRKKQKAEDNSVKQEDNAGGDSLSRDKDTVSSSDAANEKEPTKPYVSPRANRDTTTKPTAAPITYSLKKVDEKVLSSSSDNGAPTSSDEGNPVTQVKLRKTANAAKPQIPNETAPTAAGNPAGIFGRNLRKTGINLVTSSDAVSPENPGAHTPPISQ